MITALTNGNIDLARAGLLNLRARSGSSVACERGLVWVTVEGEPGDYWLPAGESMVIRRSGHVVIEAAQLSRVALQAPAASRRWHCSLLRLSRFIRRPFHAQASAA